MQRSNPAAPTGQSFSNAYEIGSRRNTRRSIAKLLRRSRPESGRPGSVRRAQRTVRRSSVGDLHGRHVARGVVALPIHDSYIVPRVSKNCAKTRLPGWGGRTRTGESVRELSDWNPVTTSPEVGQAWRRRLSRASCVKRICSSGQDFGRRSLARKSELSRGSIGPTPSCTRLLS